MQLVHSLASIDNYGHPAGGSKWTLLAELKLPALGFGGFCLQVAGGVGFPVGTNGRDITVGSGIHQAGWPGRALPTPVVENVTGETKVGDDEIWKVSLSLCMLPGD